MHVFRCTSCGTAAYSAASLDRLGDEVRCEHCGGDLETVARPRRFASTRRREAATESGLRYLRRPA